MNRFLNSLLLAVLIVSAGCRKPVPYRGPEIQKPTVEVLSKYPAGSEVQPLIDDFNLSGPEVRYRSGLPAGRTSAVYFMDNGNLHVEAQVTGDGRNLLLAVPYFEPAEGTTEERMAKWDNALEPANYPDRKN
jgi:hypothetical protein